MFFSSESNSYPMYYNQSPTFTNAIPENNTILFQQHYGKYNNYILPPTYHSISENPIFKLPSIYQENNSNTLNYPSNLMMNHMSSTRKTAKKKDRHTKICTAQGIRDRRVRLSMSIAREFFNLQDMLGFDKASKTLGWLLGKSKVAIDELASCSNNNIASSGGDFYEDDEKNGLEGNSSSKKRKRGEVNQVKDQNLMEDIRRREKARERARERTRKKKVAVDDQLIENLDHHQRVKEDFMSSAAATLDISTPIISKGISVGDTVVIRENRSSSGSSFDYCYETITSKDDQECGNYYHDYFNKSATESCNYGGIMQSPSLLPALNIINLSTEIHINARPWDAYSNQILH